MELSFEQSLLVRTSTIKIQECSRQELEQMFMSLLKFNMHQQNTFNNMIRGDVNNQTKEALSKTKEEWSESFLQY